MARLLEAEAPRPCSPRQKYVSLVSQPGTVAQVIVMVAIPPSCGVPTPPRDSPLEQATDLPARSADLPPPHRRQQVDAPRGSGGGVASRRGFKGREVTDVA